MGGAWFYEMAWTCDKNESCKKRVGGRNEAIMINRVDKYERKSWLAGSECQDRKL